MNKIDYFSVSIVIRGDDLDPEQVSKQLGVNPTKSRYKGQTNITITKHKVVAQIGLWRLSSQDTKERLSDQIIDLASKIESTSALIMNIAGVEEAYVDVFTGKTEGVEYQFWLNREGIAALAKLNLPVRFTVASIPAEKDCGGEEPTDKWGVNPDTGDVIDPSGDFVGNLGDE